MISILGPTATGKTQLAAQIANKLNAEIISADSRQVYKGMDIGTGKDLSDYIVEGKTIPFHLIDIVEPGYEYNVYEFQKDFLNVYDDITSRGKEVVLCGGTGMYIEAVLRGYKLINVPDNIRLRNELSAFSDEELIKTLKSFKSIHNITDTNDRKRLIRAIEIQTYYAKHPELERDYPKFNNTIFGIKFEREEIRKRITQRLKNRLEKEDMLKEINNLLNKGVTPEQLKFYGLEYKFLTQYVIGEICFDEMFKLLNTAIHQFAKRQMTWFRRMEKNGFEINWIDGNLSMENKLEYIINHNKFDKSKAR
ncbi:MAG: tRNA (adenosine(37)-N6)-dimethylallyltransferase MiaA [Saprospiraceae bacterium]|nr:tRNA (adenosine(37)-N6)-dimethylallyltransferase MiaA [Saprospiraceae bacterium]